MSAPATISDIRTMSAVEACHAALDRIQATASLNAFNTIDGDRALERAAEIDRNRARYASAPLAGVPIAVKDNICTRGLKTTASSRILEHFIPPYDATVIERLHAAGAVVIGKTNCDEFAMGSSNENSAFGPAENPWAVDRIPGGQAEARRSRSATRMTPLALGSGRGGSIRQPAAMCGIVGVEADLWPRVALRAARIRIVARPDWPLRADGTRRHRAFGVIAGADPADGEGAPQRNRRLRRRLDRRR
jgi:aspartyl-tRNA(Asn)/glutamyl-tRNA(Gln) amidotransferase subunit A